MARFPFESSVRRGKLILPVFLFKSCSDRLGNHPVSVLVRVHISSTAGIQPLADVLLQLWQRIHVGDMRLSKKLKRLLPCRTLIDQEFVNHVVERNLGVILRSEERRVGKEGRSR